MTLLARPRAALSALFGRETNTERALRHLAQEIRFMSTDIQSKLDQLASDEATLATAVKAVINLVSDMKNDFKAALDAAKAATPTVDLSAFDALHTKFSLDAQALLDFVNANAPSATPTQAPPPPAPEPAPAAPAPTEPTPAS